VHVAWVKAAILPFARCDERLRLSPAANAGFRDARGPGPVLLKSPVVAVR